MSALERAENGLKMSEISGALKVLNGNITGIVDRLAVEGNLIRIPVEGDRRAMRFCPGSSGRAARLSCFIPGALCRRLRVSAGGFTKVRSGQAIAAFALTEPQSGSDVANGTLNAVQDGNDYILNGEKTWISNGGIADFYITFARTNDAPGAKGLSAFIVPADTSGLRVKERLNTIAPHPLALLEYRDCRVPKNAMIGQSGDGFKIAMSVLDVFRSTVAAAALGFARRAFDAALARSKSRQISGGLCRIYKWCRGIWRIWH